MPLQHSPTTGTGFSHWDRTEDDHVRDEFARLWGRHRREAEAEAETVQHCGLAGPGPKTLARTVVGPCGIRATIPDALRLGLGSTHLNDLIILDQLIGTVPQSSHAGDHDHRLSQTLGKGNHEHQHEASTKRKNKNMFEVSLTLPRLQLKLLA